MEFSEKFVDRDSVLFKAWFAVLASVCFVILTGCTGTEKLPEKPDESGHIRELKSTTITISDKAKLQQFSPTPVLGFGIVAGLNGTGSSECPAELRNQLVKYMIQQVPDLGGLRPNDFINSKDTAVVEVYGTIPPLPARKTAFDVKVAAMPNTQTTSLERGRLFTTELKELGRFEKFDQYSKSLAVVQGPVYIDKIERKIPNLRQGYVLGGAEVLEETDVVLILNEPSYTWSAAMRDRVNQRFGPGTANAISPGRIDLRVPAEYNHRRPEFLAMILELDIGGSEATQRAMIRELINKLIRDQERLRTEIRLTAIGKAAMPELAPLLEDENLRVRLQTARVMLNAGDDRGQPVLCEIAINKEAKPEYRIAAIETIGSMGKRNEVIPFLYRAVGDENFEVRYQAYMELKKLDDISVNQELIANEFIVDSVSGPIPKLVYVSRAKVPKIVIFGAPVKCKSDIFIQSDDGQIVINSHPNEDYISIMRQHPKKPKLIGPVTTGFELSDIIRVLCEDPLVDEDLPDKLPGLGVTYSQLASILNKMAVNDAIMGDFLAGSITNAGDNLERFRAKGR